MADHDNDPTINMDDSEPIAVRRKRRGSVGTNTHSRSDSQNPSSRPHGFSTPPSTPKRLKKRVRFSDPGPDIETESASSGLTPFIRRTSLLSTPPSEKRRHSPPSTLWNRAQYDAPISGTLQFAPLRQVLEGRVKRRLRRHRLSEEIHNIEWDKRHEAKSRRTEIERLRAELAAKDVEIQSMRDEQDIASQIGVECGTPANTNVAHSTNIQELEQKILDLQARLRQREIDDENDPNWTMSAKDPFNFVDDDDDDNMITNYDQDFTMMNDEVMTTPTRLNTSFPSPPSTMPNTPCKSTSSTGAGIQASLRIPDPENEALKTQLQSLENEVSKLTAAIAFNEDSHSRLAEKLADFLPIGELHDHSTLDSALDTVLTQLALTQSHALEKANAFSALSTEIVGLGFSSRYGPEETLETIAAQFRQARLDLEYLTPGEVVEGFENEKLLDMLVSRIRVLLKKVKESDDNIDQYHEQELLLRQQLNTRVDAMQDVQKELFLANSVVGDLRAEIEEKEVSNAKLQRALERYRDEVKGLETLIERMEKEGRQKEESLGSEVHEAQERLQDEILKHDTARADAEGKEMIIMELERRMNAALQAAAEVEKEMATLATSHNSELAEKGATIEQLKSSGLEREREHGDALALRDARVAELRDEIQRVNEGLKAAHSKILGLRKENKELEAQLEGEKTRGHFVIQTMLDQQNRMRETGMGYINGDVSVQGRTRESGGPSQGSVGSSPAVETSMTPQTVVRRGRFLDGDLARKGGKKRRRYDSGLGFLEEEDEGDIGVEI